MGFEDGVIELNGGIGEFVCGSVVEDVVSDFFDLDMDLKFKDDVLFGVKLCLFGLDSGDFMDGW